jgi:hypothetical protein
MADRPNYPPSDHPYEGWFVDGISLQDEGFMVASFIESAPGRRGEDLTIARAPGSRWRQKFYESRQQSIVIWALKKDEFGQLRGGAERNVDRLKRLFGGGLRQIELLRRIELPFERVSSRRAMVELVDTMEGQRTVLTQDGVYVQFALTLQFADPFWYEPENVRSFGSDEAFQLFNPGTVASRNGIIRIFGPAEDPEVIFEPAGTRFELEESIAYGDWVDIDSEEFTAIDQDGVSVAGSLVRDQINLFEIFPGRNMVELSDGTAEIRWRPAFL